MSGEDIRILKDFLLHHDTCKGISGYGDVIRDRLEIKQPFQSTKVCNTETLTLAAYVEDVYHVQLQEDKSQYKVVHATDCLFFNEGKTASNMCFSCRMFSRKLCVYQTRAATTSSEKSMCESSHTNYRYLNHNEKSQRMANLQRKKQETMKKLAYWSSRIKEEIHENGLSVDDEQQAYFQETITLPNVQPPFDEETPQWLLWEQQKLQACLLYTSPSPRDS